MAKFVSKDLDLFLNGTKLSTSVASVTINEEVDDIETTAFTDVGRTRIGGLRDGSIDIDFHQDYAAGAADLTIQGVGIGNIGTIQVVPLGTAATVSNNNPRYEMKCLISEYPKEFSMGDLATFSVSWPISGTVNRGTT